MAKQQVYQFDNGATLIYQKQSVFNGYSFVIGFRGGAQLDGKYKGLSHLLEHLLFRMPNKKMENNILSNILKYSINQNAFTSPNAICATFSATNNNVSFALDNIINAFCNKKFLASEVAKEVEVVKQEVGMYKDVDDDSIYSQLIKGLKKNTEFTGDDILGNNRTLNSITPEILKKYVERYFNTENLVMSITSNQSAEKVIELVNNHIFTRIPQATSPKYIVPFPKTVEFENLNGYCVIPNKYLKNVSIYLLLRERNTYSEDIDKEYACDIIEQYLLNGLGGELFDILRTKNSLVYSTQMLADDYGSAKFKIIYAMTSNAKTRKTIREICKLIRNIGENGFSKEKFEIVKKALIDTNNAKLNKFKSCSAKDNYDNFMEGIPFIDYKRVEKFIENMTYEEFNKMVMPAYKNANVSVAIEGPVDTRKIYNLVEIEEMLGNTNNSESKENLNRSVVQFSPIPDEKIEAIKSLAKLVKEQEIQEEKQKQEEEKNKKTITIDNEKVK